MVKLGDDVRQDQLILQVRTSGDCSHRHQRPTSSIRFPQLIRLMDFQLKRVNIDLKLTPYNALATSCVARNALWPSFVLMVGFVRPRTGMVEIVPDSSDVSAVLRKNNNNILQFFRKHHPDPAAEYGVQKEVMDTYLKSCAGYCVITYLLGIGDRHLDNLMLQVSLCRQP